MRYRVAGLLLFAVLPESHVIAAPAPPISGILDIGPPPKGETREQHRDRTIYDLTRLNGFVVAAWSDPEVRKSPSISALKEDPISWLSKNLRVTPEGKGDRLLLAFRAGNRAEQAAILDAILRDYMREQVQCRKMAEEKLQLIEKGMPRLKKLIATETDPLLLASYLKELDYVSSRLAELPAEIARYKQIRVIKWAK